MNTGSFESLESTYRPEHPEWFGGDANEFFFRIQEIALKSGDKIRPQVSGVTAIVGSNNAGKSTILKELKEVLANGKNSKTVAVSGVSIEKSNEISSLFSWLGAHAIFKPSTEDARQDQFVRMSDSTGHLGNMAYFWNQKDEGLRSVAPFLCFYGTAEERLKMTSSVAKRNETDDPPSHPVHSLEGDTNLKRRLSQISERVFHQPLTLDALAATVRLRVGKTDMTVPPADDISTEYRNAISALPPLDKQGDGMRSFFGQILPIMAANYPLVILDEPEAFLHPPQARALGVELGKLARDNRVQVMVATHDRSFLTGLLESEGEVTVVRVSRTADGNSTARQLDSGVLSEIWRDPVLKYTNILDSLFHKVVVLAESEIDCGYLAAALDNPERSSGRIPRSEYLFVQTGGKASFPKVATALHAVGVPVVAAPDFDLLRDKGDVEKLVKALGGNWGTEEDDLWRKATNPFTSPREPLTIGYILGAIEKAFGDRRTEAFTSEAKEEMQILTRRGNSPFADVKKYGLTAFTKESRDAVEKLLRNLEAVGIVPVHTGELEGLAPKVVSRKGPNWLTRALEMGEQNNEETQKHIDRIINSSEQLIFGD
ncbi:ATP-dependent nuclease [Glutamicibacter sp. NPDC087583]|uniref:ATP-dependent nuclease n=1 Tax=Glutamicibacter sp. NPDC087583 TaxID=3363995 RepID=UPI00382304E7